MTGAGSWTVARFGGASLDRRRRKLLRDGAVQALPPRAFDVLVELIEQRHRVVSKDDLIARCWNGEAGNDGALARVVMHVRRSIGDISDAADMICTVRGVGYRFDAEVELSAETGAPPPPSEVGPPATRLVVLPLVNETGDAALGWIELGLASMLGKSLESIPGIAVIGVHEVLGALTELPVGTPLARRVHAVRRLLNPDIVVCARVRGSASHLVLYFELHRGSSETRIASVAGADAVALALQASRRLAAWLPNVAASETAALDLGDPFVNDTFVRALRKSREGRLVEAAHLLDVVADGGVDHPEVQHELAKVRVALGDPRAPAEVEALRQLALRSDNAAWLASAGLLSSKLAWKLGDMQSAGAAAAEAAGDAERAGLADLSLQCLIDAAHHFGQCFDPRAAALLSRAIPQAERLGNRVLMCHAYHTAGFLSGLRNDWIGALRYHEAAIEIADNMAEATRSTALLRFGWTLIQLGRVEEGCNAGMEGFRCARISGSQPELGSAASTAAYGCIHARRIGEAAWLFRRLQEREDDRTVPMLFARELLLRSTFLHLTGRIDDALACIAATREACRGHTAYESQCNIAELRTLLFARRFDDLLAVCARLRRSAEFAVDPRLEPWIERTEALADHLAFGRTELALERLHRTVGRLPRCESQARMALDLAWLHLERDEAAQAERLLPPLQSWLEQSAPGLLLQARLHHEHGRFDEAVSDQRRFDDRYATTQTAFTASLLEHYEHAQRSGRRQAIERIDLPLNFQYGLSPSVVQELPAELGGPREAAVAG